MPKTSPKSQAARPGRRRIGEVDVRVGRALRTRRMALGLTLDELARAVGLSAQQIYKYEVAQTRIPAARLNTLSQALRFPLAEFFGEAPLASDAPLDSIDDLQYEVMRLLRTVSDHDQQRLALRLIRAVVAELTKN